MTLYNKYKSHVQYFQTKLIQKNYQTTKELNS